MPNQNGSVYGLTILSPIIDDANATPSHDLQIRAYLAKLSTREDSPFAISPGTHLAGLADSIPSHLDAIWSHCVGYPKQGAADRQAFIAYMKSCQLETTFYFAAVNDKSVPGTLRALQTQTAVADFIAAHQGADPAMLQRDFLDLAATLKSQPAPRPGSMGPHRAIKTGGHNE